MRLIERTDSDGYKHLYHIKDNDLDTAPGIRADPPDIRQLDWEGIARQIHNGLVENKLISRNDIQYSKSGLDSIILTAIKRPLVALYRSMEVEND